MFPVRDELITPDFLVCWSLTQIVSKGSHLKTIHFTGWVVTSINSADKAKRIKVLDDPTRGLSSPETEFGVSFRSADIYPTDDYPGGSLGSCLGPKSVRPKNRRISIVIPRSVRNPFLIEAERFPMWSIVGHNTTHAPSTHLEFFTDVSLRRNSVPLLSLEDFGKWVNLDIIEPGEFTGSSASKGILLSYSVPGVERKSPVDETYLFFRQESRFPQSWTTKRA
ncbi:unnamed protein product [Nesidiocoris tenuis]|uniref:Uncharacterized protein n=1 Tax=Nesidiocoris tenuis TaxID=355587 RepID=A0A6H5FUU9_9HEMI|nr:unnamed protein product [Nesidiocoris tenuis]